MDFAEKAKIRIEHWIRHNEDHLREYEEFAKELDEAGNNDSADHIRNMLGILPR